METSIRTKLIWWLLLAAAFALPWVVVIASNDVLQRWFPGQFKVSDWRDLASISFLLGGLVAAALIIRTPQPLFLRAPLALLVFLGSLALAYGMQLRSKCGDEPMYIGQREDMQIASCQ